MKTQYNKKVMAMIAAFAISQLPMHANAGERESLEQLRDTTLNLIDLLVQEGVLSKSKADIILKQADEAKRAQAKIDAEQHVDLNPEVTPNADASKDKVVRVQYVPEHVKKQIRDEIEKDVMSNLNYKAGERLGLPAWIDRVKWKGDLRLRYQRDMFADDNTPLGFLSLRDRRNINTIALNNTTEERDRLRWRTRFGMDINVNNWLSSELRIATGGFSEPTSTTTDLGSVNPGQGNSKFSIGLDRASFTAKLKPWLEMGGGRFANPYFSSDLVWDDDFAFDGVYAKFKPQINDRLSGFGVIGAHPVDEIDNSELNAAQDKWLFGAQAGLQWLSANNTKVRVAASYYDYQAVEGESNPLGNTTLLAATAPATRQKGNNTFSIDRNNNSLCGNGGLCGLASEFDLVNLNAEVDIAKFNPVHVILTADYVRNIGFDQAEILSRTGLNYEEETEGYQVRLLVGSPTIKEANNWQVFGGYKYLEADAVLDAFTDSNFHLGGTDVKGWILGGSYGLDKDAWLTARWFSADEISGLPLSIDVLLVDLNARF